MTDKTKVEQTVPTVSEDISTLSKFITLEPTTIESVRWITGERSIPNAGGLIPSSPDWWLFAEIRFKAGFDLGDLQSRCELLYTLDDGREYQGELKTKLGINADLGQTANLSVYDACVFKSDVLANGAMILDAAEKRVYLKMFTS